MNESNLTVVAVPPLSCLANRPILVIPLVPNAVDRHRRRRCVRTSSPSSEYVRGHVRAVVLDARSQSVVRRRRELPGVRILAAVGGVDGAVGGQDPLRPDAVQRLAGEVGGLVLDRRLGEVVRVLLSRTAPARAPGRWPTIAVVVELRRHRPRTLRHRLQQDVAGGEVRARDIARRARERQVATADGQVRRRRVGDLPLGIERGAVELVDLRAARRGRRSRRPASAGRLPETTLNASNCDRCRRPRRRAWRTRRRGGRPAGTGTA